MKEKHNFPKSIFCPNCKVELEIEDRELDMDRIKCPNCKKYIYRKYFDLSNLHDKQRVILRSYYLGKNKPLITFKSRYWLSIIFIIIGILYSSVDLLQGHLIFTLSAIYNIKKHRMFRIQKKYENLLKIIELLLCISLIPTIFYIIGDKLWYKYPITYLFVPLLVIVLYYQLSNSNPIVSEVANDE